MYLKIVHPILRNILDFFWTMTNSGASVEVSVKQTDDDRVRIYSFKPFCYDEIKPKGRGKLPYPRSGHRIGADSGNFYSFGGYNPVVGGENNSDEIFIQSFPLLQEIWKFNFALKEWTRYRNSHTLPQELASNALILHKNILMVYGGTGSPFGFRCSNQLFVCRVDSKGLMDEVNTTGQLPLPAYGQALIYHNDYLYTIGGTTGVQYTCDIHRLNLITLVWEVVYMYSGNAKYEPEGRYRHEVGFDDRNIYVLGGGTAVEAFDLSEIPVYSLEKEIWYPQKTTRDPRYGIPHPRRCHGAAQLKTEDGIQVFIVGGHDGENVFDDLWRLDLTTFQWTYFEKCRLPFPTYFHAAAATPEGRLCIFGGICSYNPYDSRRSNCVYSTWLCIPKLSEMCWEAVLHYSPHIAECNSEHLINIGLPRHYVQRLGNTSAQTNREQQVVKGN